MFFPVAQKLPSCTWQIKKTIHSKVIAMKAVDKGSI